MYIQNYVVNNLENGANSSFKKAINIASLLNEKIGSCFDRSLLMQKIFLLNDIKVRPVYIFFSPYRKQTSILDFLKGSTYSHNTFEYYYDSDWYILETNKVQKKVMKLDEYIDEYFPSNDVLYFRHLNNRNSYMLDPWFLPDIY
jgi:hypothetical protein